MLKQHNIEKKFTPEKVIGLSSSTQFDQAFGPIADWTLELGNYQLLLDPLSGLWHINDQTHKTWDTTGFMAGEVTFVVEEGELFVIPNHVPTIWPRDRRYDAAEDRFRHLNQRLFDDLIDKKVFSEAVQAMTLKDRKGVHWRIREADGGWTWWNGRAWVPGAPQRKNLPIPYLGPWQKFAEVKWRYFELWNQKEAGGLSEAAFVAEVNKLRVQDDRQVWWQVRAEDGAWLRWDGHTWVEGQPTGI